MMLIIEKEVNIKGISNELMLAILGAVVPVFYEFKHDTVMTSCLDGKHSVTSLHYSGNAADFRTRFCSEREKLEIHARLRTYLNEDFDVILEPTHLHIEYQPRKARR